MSEVNLDDTLSFAIGIAREAGRMILEGQAKRFALDAAEEKEKVNSVDLVTEVDKAVEAFIVQKIKEAYPTHQFIGEETFDGQKITNEPTWIDGTTNFIHGFPMVCTSIGLAVKGVPVIGVIYNPFLDQLWYDCLLKLPHSADSQVRSAAKGQGAFLNKTRRLPLTGKPKPLASLGQALIGVEYGSSRSSPALPSKVKTFQTLASHTDEGGKMVHSLRSLGSAALNICMVASGGLDMYWEIGCWAWDVCAGICILTEAGGMSLGGKDTALTGQVDGALLTGRKYLFVRSIARTETESVEEVQQRFAKEFYETTADDFDP
ncbi:myo-inositol-1(or 4)-monophosphatase, partial [Tremellales sp. Uapishka_1]